MKADHKEALDDCTVNLRTRGISGMENLQDAYLELRELAQAYLDSKNATNDVTFKAETALREALKNE